MRTGVFFAVALAISLASIAASANGGGVAGYTGKPSSFAPQGESCNQCHNGGTAPQVSITGPASLAAGQSGDYTLVVSTGQTRAAGAVAATDGVLLTPGVNGGFRDSFGEMVQDAAKTVNGGQATFTFRVKAPATGNTLRLWAVGLAANGAGTAGDRATQITRDITVTGGGTAPPPSTDAGAPSSSSSSGAPAPAADGGSPPSGGGSTPTTAGSSPTTGDDDEADPADPADPAEDDGTPASSGRRSSSPQAAACSASSDLTLASEPMLVLTGIAALALLGRRGRPARRRRMS